MKVGRASPPAWGGNIFFPTPAIFSKGREYLVQEKTEMIDWECLPKI